MTSGHSSSNDSEGQSNAYQYPSETYYCDNECDPHEEVEPSEHVAETLLPTLSFLGEDNDIFAENLG